MLMMKGWPRLAWLMALFALCLIALAVIYLYAKDRARSALIAETQATALLYEQALRAALDRRRHIPAVLATDVDVASVAIGGAISGLNRRLEELADATEAEAIYLLDRQGLTVAASNWRDEDSFLGQNYAFRDYFRTAMEGRTGSEFAIGATTGRPGTFVSHPILGQGGAITGAVVVKIDLTPLNASWNAQDSEVLLVNSDGIVLLAGRSEWHYRSTSELSERRRASLAAKRQFADHDLTPLNMTGSDGVRVTLDGTDYLRVVQPVGWLDWKLWLLAPASHAADRAFASVAYASVAMLIVLTALAVIRSERFRSALSVSQREQSELVQLNNDLNHQIEVRKAAEIELREAQAELRRTTRLAALGQIAASVTHELGQPLSAMKTYVRGAQRDLERGNDVPGGTLERLDRLVDRISGIAHQLRFFARRSGEPMQPIDLRAVIAGAGETIEPMLRENGARLDQHLPPSPALVIGDQRRLEQVLVNIIRNALDAMNGHPEPRVMISIDRSDSHAQIRVRDNGHGIAPDIAQSMFEPFATTRASGEGMGLGLAISAGIVQEHRGAIGAANIDGGGAEFVIDLPLSKPES